MAPPLHEELQGVDARWEKKNHSSPGTSSHIGHPWTRVHTSEAKWTQ